MHARAGRPGYFFMMNRIRDVETVASPNRIADGDLLAQFVKCRDDSAFAELVARHGRMVFGVCLRRLGQCADAEDAFQAVFLSLAKHAEGLASRMSVGPWLYTVVRQVTTKALRSQRRRRWLPWGAAPEPQTVEPVGVDVDLDAALATLSESERSAIVLCHLEGLSRSEAAKALGCPEGTLSARLSRGLEKLRKKLGKPPLAILAATMLVIVPDSLPAATVGLVRHLRDGTLDDWASPSVLDLYRKALPMRLLDRFGPAIIAVVAAVLILVGANFGWQIITAQPPADAKQPPKAAPQGAKKLFAAAVDEIQGKKKEPTQTQQTVVRFQMQAVASNNPERRKTFPWDIKVKEVIGGIEVVHFINTWEAIPVLLKQIASSGHKRIDVTLAPEAVTRLEANQILNACKRAGFEQVGYNGPKPFLGTQGDLTNASGVDVPSIDLTLDLIQMQELLPDWTNGWVVNGGQVSRLKGEENVWFVNPFDLHQIIMSFGGARGPAAGLLEFAEERIKSQQEALGGGGGGLGGDFKKAVPPTSDLIRQIEKHQRAAAAPRIIITMLPKQPPAGGSITQVSNEQKFASGDTWVQSPVIGPAGELIRRSLTTKTGRVEIKTGLAGNQGPIVNPLDVNLVLNACKRAGAKSVEYSGQKIVTGTGKEYAFEAFLGRPNGLPIVNVSFSLENLEGDLPDETNGWSVVRVGGTVYIVSDEARKKELQSMTTSSGELRGDPEVMRLAKLPRDELERELAKKPSLLRDRFRKSVEEVKAKLK
jgi:RNA polymerase sigma factor (sigma-70 family)